MAEVQEAEKVPVPALCQATRLNKATEEAETLVREVLAEPEAPGRLREVPGLNSPQHHRLMAPVVVVVRALVQAATVAPEAITAVAVAGLMLLAREQCVRVVPGSRDLSL